ncbi:hypothetical protein CC86DRAFT_422601 [Ophiobolus disseminans]|uniref:MYND-type domain-containing protein n=1 Tax=Ophiobolus disseminans TaxID=1469910 RepID=A0A6A6ZR81_9PLEO|nr:hypothetical protein CC86DRAFT_422601 [Ophiobolus disseminans]
MSLKSVHIAQAPFFYPNGNTPAVCLTQSIPAELGADLLLLGCHAGSRKLDFTCCDIEAEIIARNILALTLIIDDAEGIRTPVLWNIYYHVFINLDALHLIQTQAKKLLTHTKSMEIWQQSKYANIVRFCDSTTLKSVAKLWELYAINQSQKSLYREIQERLKRQWNAAKRYQAGRTPGGGFILDGLRSRAPLLGEGLLDVSARYHSHWKRGTCFEDRTMIQEMTIANPLLVCERAGLMLHYGTTPTAGFHLSSMYARSSATSPSSMPTSRDLEAQSMPKDMRAALEQLRAWCDAFRHAAARVTIRYVNSDAIALCHVLQQQQSSHEKGTAFWYRHAHTYEALVLDSTDYVQDGSGPTTFDVIDTSNLLDHLGTLNILTACTPFLRRLPTSTLRTEMLVPREADVSESTKNLLCGDLPTMALLLGLRPAQYWTDATATWNPNASLLRDIPNGEKIRNALNRPVVLWKPVDTSLVRYDAAGLARFILKLYLRMFQDERWMQRFDMLRNMSMLQRRLQSYDLYTRASLAAFLRYVKNSEVVDWTRFIRELLEERILNDRTLDMGPHHFQSLFTHVDMLELSELGEIFEEWRPQSYFHDMKGVFRNWTDMPSVVCVTIVVPHKTVKMFDDLNKGNGTPICELQIQSSVSMKQANYPDIQMGFGTVETFGKPFTNDYVVSVREDPKGWRSLAPMVVSAVVSTCALVEYGDTAGRVVFQLKNTPTALASFAPRLGMFLQLHQSAVGEKDVCLVLHLCLQRKMLMRVDDATKVTITPLLDVEAHHFQSIRVRYDIRSEKPKRLLQNGGIVDFHSFGPFNLILMIDSTYRKSVALPLPVDIAAGKVKIARKSLWIEYLAPVAKVSALTLRPDSVFPIYIDLQSRPILDQLHYVDSDVLPKLENDSMNKHASWLMAHTSISATMSRSEECQYSKTLAKCLVMPGRLGVKESLHTMYTHVFGLGGQAKSRFFCLNEPTNLGIICIDSVRLDISNQSVLMDGARSSMGEEKDELRFWISLLPAFAERCPWKRIPISSELGERFMCTCGLGVFPSNYLADLKGFKELSAYAVRIAIPLIFASPISLDVIDAFSNISDIESKPTPAYSTISQHERRSISRLNKLDGEGEKSTLQKCAGCQFAQYCSKKCQAQDWKEEHKHICKKLKILNS